MKSVYAKILAWCLATLFLSLLAAVEVGRVVSMRSAGRSGPFAPIQSLEAEEDAEAYETGGKARLAEMMALWNRYLPATKYFTDRDGRDLLTGADRSALLARVGSDWGAPHQVNGHMVVASRAGDRYCLIIIAPPRLSAWNFAPYYVLILAAVALLLWLLAVYLASPLRALAATVRRFGHGELSLRFETARQDEIGDLARTFNEMAERIETLLTAERRLLQDISHELRTPLARLSFAAELTRNADDREAAVARMNKEIGRLTHLVNALIEVTRSEGDPAARPLQLLSLTGLVAEVVEDCRLEADGRKCRLELAPAPAVSVRGDQELLRRAVENIVRNAVRYSPEDTAVQIALERHHSVATLVVRDFGPGVPEKDLPRIFRPFFRADSSRDSATGGLGLGLAIAQRAITLHHGELSARNAQPGLLVTLSLPTLQK